MAVRLRYGIICASNLRAERMLDAIPGKEHFTGRCVNQIDEFLDSFGNCRQGLRAARLRAALATLGKDRLFSDAGIGDYLTSEPLEWKTEVASLFRRQSSGHAIVLIVLVGARWLGPPSQRLDPTPTQSCVKLNGSQHSR